MSRKKRERVKTYKIINQTWQYALFLRVGGTVEAATRWFDKKFDVDSDDSANISADARTSYVTDERSHLIWFKHHCPGAGLIAHEAFHSTKHVLTHAGLGPLNDETEEAFAYLLMWTVREIGQRIW